MESVKVQMTSAPIMLANKEKRPPRHQRPAHHNRQDGIQFIVETIVIAIGAMDIGAEDQAGDGAAKAAKGIRQQLDILFADTAVIGRF